MTGLNNTDHLVGNDRAKRTGYVRRKAAFMMDEHLLPMLFTPEQQAHLRDLLDVDLETIHSVDQLGPRGKSEVELLIAGWGAAALTEEDLGQLPSLQAVVHWAGGMNFVPDGGRRRGIAVSVGRSVNAIPVAEWTIAMVVLSANDAFWVSRRYMHEQRFVDREAELPRAGLYRKTIGIVGASSIGRLVIEYLRHLDVHVLCFDPYVSGEEMMILGAERVDDLVELARRSDVLSLHAPSNSETRGMISDQVLDAMPPNATLINTARGALVDQAALVQHLVAGRLRAVLDVTEPEVLPPGHPLYSLSNVFLTPHLAGSMGTELRRLGEAALEEIERFVAGRPFSRPEPEEVNRVGHTT